MVLSPRDRKRLEGLHPDLVRVVEHAVELDAMPFMVLEGVRSPERQRTLVAAGASTTTKSRHIPAPDGLAYAVDLGALVGRDLRWDWPLYRRLGEVVKAAAREVGVAIEWGGDWKTFKDGPHFQLPWRAYPGTAQAAGSGRRKVA